MKQHYQPKRILLVGPVPPPMGGMSLQTMHFYQALKKEQHHITLLASNLSVKPAVLNRIRFLRTLVRFVIFRSRLKKHLINVDVVHVMSNSGLAWFLTSAPTLMMAQRLKVPVIVNYRGGSAEKFLKNFKFLIHLSLKNAYAIVVPSQYLANVFAEYGYTTHVIPNTVDVLQFKPSQTKTQGFRCLVARNLEAIYGVDTAIRALHLVRTTHPNIELHITGEGSQKSALEALVCELGLKQHVHFLGRLSKEQMATAYTKASLLLNPSRVDNMPNALLEAQAAGVPIVSSNVGGIPYMVDHNKTAVLIPPNDIEALARAIIAVYEDSNFRENLIKQGLENSKRFTWDSIKLKWEEIYEEVG